MSKKYYSSQSTPNFVSSTRDPKDRSFLLVVGQSGKPRIDFEANFSFDLVEEINNFVSRNTNPSGFIQSQRKINNLNDFEFPLPTDLNFNANSFWMNKRDAIVAGFPVTIEYANTNTAGKNLIQLTAAPTLGGAPPDVRRTDFVFLEVWPALVGPSLKATAYVDVIDYSAIIAGDTITLNGNVLTAVVGAPGVDQFQIGANGVATATNITTAINALTNSYYTEIFAATDGTTKVYLIAVDAGAAGNLLTLATSNITAFTISGAFFAGGADRPNKPSPSTIYRHGNTQSSTTVAFSDDLIDPTIAIESSQRVQIQYRIRVTGQTEAVNFKTDPDGFSSTVLAQGGLGAPVATYPFVPADLTTVSGNSSAVNYGYQDSGLWVAGDGTSTAASALQSLTGYVYAIPIGFVFRRNNAYLGGAGPGFSPTTGANSGITYNHPGFVNPVIGAIPAGESDRPDGLFYDAIDLLDFKDLRHHVCPSGFDFVSEMDYQTKLLLDGRMRTWAIDIADKQELGSSSGCVSTQPLVCNEVGRDSAHGGNNSTSGDTTRGVTVRNFDHLARRFASHQIVERAVFSFYPQDRDVGPVTAPGLVNPGKYVVKDPGAPSNLAWFAGDELHLDLSVLDATTDGTFNLPGTYTGSILDFAPPGTVITDVLLVEHDDGRYGFTVPQNVEIRSIDGVGSSKVIVTLDTNPRLVTGGIIAATHPMVGDSLDNGSPRRIFLEVEITYPKGIGLTDTVDLPLEPVNTVYPFGPMIENAVSQRPSDMEVPIAPSFRDGYREVALEYIASNNGMGAPIVDSFVSRNGNTVRPNRRLYGSASNLITATDAVTATPATINTLLTKYGSSERTIDMSALSSPQTLVNVTYYAQDPVPNYGSAGGGYQLSFYYRTNAPQTAGSKSGVITGTSGLPITLSVEPLAVSDKSYIMQIAAGSSEKAYPYLNPSDQIPINPGLLLNVYEWYFSGSSNVGISDFDANTGMIKLSHLVPVDSTDQMDFGGVLNPPVLDNEFRAYYPFMAADQYRPTSMSQPLAFPSRHKTVFTILGKVVDSGYKIFRENEIVLIVISNFYGLSEKNTVAFTDFGNSCSASVYRTQNRLTMNG